MSTQRNKQNCIKVSTTLEYTYIIKNRMLSETRMVFSGELPDGKEKHVIGNWKKSYPCHKWHKTRLDYFLLLNTER